MTADERQMRIAVAEEKAGDVLAPRLGRALKFGLFDISGQQIRGPFYRVRHDDPGNVCDDHAELVALLHDCKVVIAGAAGTRMAQRLLDRGIEVVITAEQGNAKELVSRYLSGKLERIFEFIPETEGSLQESRIGIPPNCPNS